MACDPPERIDDPEDQTHRGVSGRADLRHHPYRRSEIHRAVERHEQIHPPLHRTRRENQTGPPRHHQRESTAKPEVFIERENIEGEELGSGVLNEVLCRRNPG